jgi:hypothetical protein
MMSTGTAPNPWWRPKSYPAQSYSNSPDASLPATEPAEPPPRVPTTIQGLIDSQALPIAPSGKKARTLVVCLDGTGDKFDNDNSNVVQLMACLKKDDPYQLTYYQSGIGTYDGGGMTKGIASAIDMAVGSGLGIHIRDAYTFLM